MEKTLMDHINVLVWTLKDENTVIAVNETLANFFQRNKVYFYMKSSNDNFTQEERELLFEDNQKVFSTKNKVTIKKKISDPSGKAKILSITKVPKLDEDGSIKCVVCTAIDITKQESLKKALDITIDNLNASENFLTLNFQKASSGILLSDKNGKIILFNETLCKMLGYNMHDLMNINIYDIMHPEDILKNRYLLNVLAEKRVEDINMEARLLVRSGTYIWVNFYSRLSVNGTGYDDYILSYIENISDRKSAENMIREQREEIKSNRAELEFNKLKNKFFANLSHEFKTPLNLIFSSLHLIEMHINKMAAYSDDKKIRSYTGIIKQNSYRLLRLVHNLIDLTKMSIDDYHLNLKKCDLIALIKQIISSVESYMKESGRKFVFNCKIKDKELTCDPLAIERILLNLLSNAIKFTKKGDRIILSITEKNGIVIISVKDTGIGIKHDKLDMIFEQFRQVDETFKRGSEVSGIGLSITKYLVELHGGSINVKSEYGKGSEFIVEIPICNDSYYYNAHENGNVVELTNKVDIEFSDIYNL